MVRYNRGAFFAERMILWQEKKPAFTNVKMVAGKHAMSRRLEWTGRKDKVRFTASLIPKHNKDVLR